MKAKTEAVQVVRELPPALVITAGAATGLAAGVGLASLVERVVPPAQKYAPAVASFILAALALIIAAASKGIVRNFMIGAGAGAMLDLIFELLKVFYPPAGQFPWPGY
jgi:hypothetical protein